MSKPAKYAYKLLSDSDRVRFDYERKEQKRKSSGQSEESDQQPPD